MSDVRNIVLKLLSHVSSRALTPGTPRGQMETLGEGVAGRVYTTSAPNEIVIRIEGITSKCKGKKNTCERDIVMKKRWRAEAMRRVLYRAAGYNDLGRDLEELVRSKATESIELVIEQTNDVRHIRDVRRMREEYFQHHRSLVLWDIYALKNEHNLPFMNALELIAQSMQENPFIRIDLNETNEKPYQTLFPEATQDRKRKEVGAEVYRLSLLIVIPIVDDTYGEWQYLSPEHQKQRKEYMEAVYGLWLKVEQLIQSASESYRPASAFNKKTHIIRTENVHDRYFPADQLNGMPYIRKDMSIGFQPKITSTMRDTTIRVSHTKRGHR